MNTVFTHQELAEWVESIKEAAKDDTSFSIAWFRPTESCPYAIIAGWMSIPDMPDEFCKSKSHPEYVMCIKVAENNGPYAYTDYEIMDMPYDRVTEEVDDTEIMLEWNDPAEYVADHYLNEWRRIMSQYA